MQARATLLVKGGKLLDLDADPYRPRLADILIEDGIITGIRDQGSRRASGVSETAPIEIVDAAGKLVVPGFVNAHYHSHDVLLKGCFDPSVLEFWVLNALPRAYPPRSDAEVRLRTLLGAVECIRGGITTVQDMLTLSPLSAGQVEVVTGAYREAGLRVILGLQVANVSPLDTTPFWREIIPVELQANLLGPPPPGAADPLAVMEEIFRSSAPDAMRRFAVSPSSPERCSRALLEALADLAKRFDLPVYSHIYISRAEALHARSAFAAYGGSLIAYLDAVGLLGPRLTLAHGVWLDDAEIAVLAAKGVNVVLNLLSNLKTKNGVAPIRPLLQAGINLALGCDNCSCSDAQNIFQAMKLFTLLAAVSDPSEGPPDAIDAIRAATIGGARTAGMEKEIGTIRVGGRADLVLLDLTDPVYVPFNSAARQLVYGEGGRGVETVIIDGRVVMRDRKILSLDEAALRTELDAVMVGFRQDAEAVMARTAKLRPHILDADKRIWAQELGLHRYVGRQ
ncbi:guanine deaminase [Rhizobiales bacterium GAS113]|nr:guanine deaminase [Rhizobiales bacterium GAS113]